MTHSNIYKALGIFLVSFTILASCSTFKRINETNYYLLKNPPNGIKVADNFYCDETEVKNVDWLEYVFWTKKVFGESSEEYFSAIPDNSVWSKIDTCFSSFEYYYFKSANYYYYPVVGISQKQAEKYSKWRSDRVFEQILIDFNIIKYDTAQTKETYFTIEKYYNGSLPSLISYEKIKFYPDYHLPSFEERKSVISYTDSVAVEYYDNCKSKKCNNCKENYPIFNSDNKPCDSTKNITIPSDIIVDSDCYIKKGNPIYNIRGNVSEWSDEKDISFGGSWIDRRERILANDTFYTENVNAWTGFRNVCEWKKWKE